MVTQTEIFVEGYKLDISDDLDSLITFAIDDVKNFASRQTAFSKTVVLPGTANNNTIFGSIFDTGISNVYDSAMKNVGINFNAMVSAACIIFQDNVQTFKGTLRLLEIDIDKKRIEYQVALNGNLTTLNVALSSGYIADLDFSAYNQLWTAANITASWDNPGGSGIYFPLMDYGNYSQGKHDWDFRTMRPALYVKEYIDKMFASAGFRYSCDLFNTPRFKSLVVPHNQKTLLSQVSRVLTANETSSHTIINTGIGTTSGLLPWDTIIAGGFSYSLGTFTYTQPTALTAIISWNLGGDRFSATPGNFIVNIRRNGSVIATTTITTFNVHITWQWISSVSVPVVTGDTFDVQLVYGGTGTGMIITASSPNLLTMDSAIPTLQPVDYNQMITLNDILPQNIRKVDFLVSIVTLFNLYVYEDKWDETLIHISPFINFYSGTDTVDWTYKLNRDGSISIKPMSELTSKLYNFNYASDSDYWNDLYNKRYNQVYGSYIFDSQFQFADQTNTATLIFAPTPLVGYVGEEKVYGTLFKRTGNITGAGEENVDSVIRIMQTKKIMGVSTWQIKNVATVLLSLSYYGYAGHFDDPDAPTNDLNFGALNELFFILATGDLTKTQFNVYWSAYMAEITNKDSKLLTAQFYLKPNDIFNLDFSHYVYVDGSLYRLNKITDYNCTQPALCTVELLKVINTTYQYVTFPPIVDTFRWLDADGSFVLDSDNSVILHQ